MVGQKWTIVKVCINAEVAEAQRAQRNSLLVGFFLSVISVFALFALNVIYIF